MEITIKNLLLRELTKKQTRNPSYSLRAFARDLQIGITTLSDVLAGKRNLSKKNLEKVIERLMLSPLEKAALENHPGEKPQKVDERLLLSEDSFRLIADWPYLALLNLAKLPNNKAADPAWSAQRLGLKSGEVEIALERLYRLDLVKKKKHQLIRTSQPLTTTDNVPSEAIRKHHNQNLILAEKALHNEVVSRRDFISATLAVNVEKLPQAKEILLKTRKKIAALLETGPTSEVYTLAFQLFPLTTQEEIKAGSKK